MTQREKIMEALIALGEQPVLLLTHYFVFTRRSGGFYYIGKSGALRFGLRAPGKPVPADVKDFLLGHDERLIKEPRRRKLPSNVVAFKRRG